MAEKKCKHWWQPIAYFEKADKDHFPILVVECQECGKRKFIEGDEVCEVNER